MLSIEKCESITNFEQKRSLNNDFLLSFSILQNRNDDSSFLYHFYDVEKCFYMTILSKKTWLQYILVAIQKSLDVFSDDCYFFSTSSAHQLNRLYTLKMIINAEFNTNLHNKSSNEFQSLQSSIKTFVSLYFYLLKNVKHVKVFVNISF
jgi:hypothetical protein